MLSKQRITIPLAEGVDAGDVDPKLPGNTLTKAENAVYPRRGAVGRRNGYTALTQPVTGGNNNIAEFDGKPLLYGSRIYLRDSGTETSGGWVSGGGNGSEIMLTDAEAIDTTNAGAVGVWQCDVAEDATNDLRCVVEERSDTSRMITVIQRSTGAVLDTATITGGGAIRCVARGNSDDEIVIWYVNGSAQLRYRTVSTAGVISSGTTAASSIDSATLGVAVISDDVYVTYLTTALTSCYVGKLTAAASFSSASYHGGLTAGGVVGLDAVSGGLALLVTDTAGGVQYLYARFCNTSLTMHTTAQTIDSDNSATYSYTQPVAVAGSDSDDAYVYWTRNDVSSTPSDRIVFSCSVTNALTASPTVNTPAASVANCSIAASPIYDSVTSNHFLVLFGPCLFDDGLDSAYFLAFGALGSLPYAPVGRALVNQAMSQDGGRGLSTAWVQDVGSGQFQLGLPSYSNNDFSGAKMVRWTLGGAYANSTSTTLRAAADTLSDSLVMAGSVPIVWDGESAVEVGFLTRPIVAASIDATTGGALSAGIYGYAAVYEYVDAHGRVHQSAPSDLVSVDCSAGASRTVDVLVRTLPLTRKGLVRCVVYRTTAGGNVLYRAGVVSNDIAANTVQFDDDTLADSTGSDPLISREQLYTSRGLVENVAPPPTRVTCVHQRRHFCVDRDEESTTIRYSKRYERGSGIEHSDSLVLYCDPTGGAITAIASHYDKLVIFKGSPGGGGRLYATQGAGLNADAVTGLDYAEPHIISTDIGAVDPHGVVNAPMGLAFWSSKGIYLLDRSMRVTPIGEAVRYYTDGYDTGVVSAVTVPEESIAIWIPDDAATRTEAVVWNYKYNLWSTWTGHAGLGACAANGRLHWTDGDDVYVRTDAYADPSSTAITLTLETRPIPVGDLLGEGRIYESAILGQPVARSRISAQAQYSYDAVWDTAQTHDTAAGTTHAHTDYYGAGLASTYDDDAMLLKYDTSRKRCAAVRFRIKCDGGAAATLQTQGAEFSALSMLVGVKPNRVAHGGGREMS